jgi:hypothetical protein
MNMSWSSSRHEAAASRRSASSFVSRRQAAARPAVASGSTKIGRVVRICGLERCDYPVVRPKAFYCVPDMTAALVECCRKVVLLKCDRLYLGVNGGVSIVPEGRWRSAGTGRGSANDAAVVGAHIRRHSGAVWLSNLDLGVQN